MRWKNHRDHLEACDMKGPAIILAGSGMCTGGRIVDHLQKGIDDPKNDILFVGYQAPAPPAGPSRNMPETRRLCRPRRGAQNHQGQGPHPCRLLRPRRPKGLVDWIAAMPEKPGAVKLVHGEAARNAPPSLFKSEGRAKRN
jgi:metallo-beta-lactamase family protein